MEGKEKLELLEEEIRFVASELLRVLNNYNDKFDHESNPAVVHMLNLIGNTFLEESNNLKFFNEITESIVSRYKAANDPYKEGLRQ